MAVQDEIRSFIQDTFFVESFGADDSFLRSGVIDSTGMLELVAFIETQYSFKIADAELVPENLDSLTKVSAFVARKRSASAAA